MRLNIFGGLRPFRPREAGRDALAGVTLASMNIPQVLGYTRIAGTPVVGAPLLQLCGVKREQMEHGYAVKHLWRPSAFPAP